jgi:hypothetical protein
MILGQKDPYISTNDPRSCSPACPGQVLRANAGHPCPLMRSAELAGPGRRPWHHRVRRHHGKTLASATGALAWRQLAAFPEWAH